ncbi:MAG: type VI secretion system ATPase TssH, partial [Deltaproteobacteria bacterium]|nr:type VI secretion system ATPase TssH [Deltaproteobacteria bacterium]
MRFDKLTIKSQEALQEAQSLGSSRGHQTIEASHLLVALLAQAEGIAVPILQKLGVSIDALGADLEKALEQQPKVTGGAPPQIGAGLARILEAAFSEAENLDDEYVSTEHLLLAMVQDESDTAGRV